MIWLDLGGMSGLRVFPDREISRKNLGFGCTLMLDRENEAKLKGADLSE